MMTNKLKYNNAMSEEKFTASNGIKIEEYGHGPIIVEDPVGLEHLVLLEDQVKALLEYAQHKRDQERGLWRDPENPDMVVYRIGVKTVIVLDETSGNSDKWERDQTGPRQDRGGPFGLVAQRYFKAHPKPQPWETPNVGDIWALTINGEEHAYRAGQYGLYQLGSGIPLSGSDAHVTAGRRIWTETTNE